MKSFIMTFSYNTKSTTQQINYFILKGAITIYAMKFATVYPSIQTSKGEVIPNLIR
jgi:hypothetical protein